MEAYPGERLIAEEIRRHHAMQDEEIDLQIGDVALPGFYAKRGVLHPNMTGVPFAQYVWRQRALYQGKTVAEMMCGCGIAGIVAAMSGAAEVTLSDFSPLAYECAFDNVLRYRLEHVRVLQSDLFEDERHRAVDVIICNPPFSHGEPPPGDYLAAAFLGGTRLVPRFFDQARYLLNGGGSLLMPNRKGAGKINDPALVGPRYGFKVVEEEDVEDAGGVQFGGPLTFYHLQRT